MPGVVVDGRDVDVMANGTLKDNSSVNRSPNSHLGSHSPKNAAANVPEVAGVDTSIEQLYDNVCEMESSGDGSSSRLSFGSAGEESRIDSELRHLVGGEAREIEIMEEESDREQEVQESDFHKEEAGSNNGKQGKTNRSHSSRSKSVSSGQSKTTPHLPVGSDGSVKLSPKTQGSNAGIPVDQEAGESTKKLNPGLTYLNRHKNFTPGGTSKPLIRNWNPSELGLDNPDMGPYLLKQARDLVSSGDNLQKALDFAVRAAKSFEKCSEGKLSLYLVMSLHMVAAIHCSLGQYDLAIPILERSIEIPIAEEGPEHALAKFSGYMQLGDTYAMVGQLENSIRCYTMGLEVQRQALGEADLRVAETCRYLAEAHVQALQFDEAQLTCQMALDIHKENCVTGSVEEAADRRLMGLICDMKGDFEAALEHLVLAGMAMSSNGQENEVALVDCSIGDTYLSLSRYDEAVFAYQKALTAFKASKGENHPSVASVFVCLADLYKKTGKLRESKEYCENALRIYSKPAPGTSKEEIAGGYTDLSAIYESLDEPEQALGLLQKALQIYDYAPGQQSTIAGIEAQMGVMFYLLGNYSDSYISFKNAITKLRASGNRKSGFFGIALNQMGLVCVQRFAINEAADLFEEARNVLEQEYGPYHPDTLGVYSNLAGTYDAMGRLDDAIEILEYVVRIREEKLGTAHPDVDDEKRRLAELLKEAGRARNRKAKSLETLLDPKNATAPVVN